METANQTATEQTLAPLCTVCCCGLLNRTLTVVFMVSLAFAIVVGNVVTLTVFMQTRHSQTPQGYLKVSLAIADMMVGVWVVPFSVYTEISLMVTSSPRRGIRGSQQPLWRVDPGPWQPLHADWSGFAGCTFVSISTIFLMTVERCVAILRPLHKDTLVTRHRTLFLIILSWAGSFLLAMTPLMLSNSFTLEYNECSRMCNYAPVLIGDQLPPDANILLLFPAFDFSLLGGTLAVNILSFTSIRSYSRKRKLLSEGSLGTDAGAVFVLGNVVGYTWCNFSFLAFWILTGNSCCNVIIYSVRDHRFRKGLTLLFQRERSQPHSEKN